MLAELVIFLVVLAAWWIIQDKRKYKGYPPGPPRFPVIGNLLQLMTKSAIPAEVITDLARTYGDVMFFKNGALDSVVFSSHDALQQFYATDKATTRASFKIPVVKERMMSRNMGIIFSNDDVWLTLRRFTLRTLRDFGFGKSQSMDFVINEEVDKLTKFLDQLIDSDPNGIVHFDDVFDLSAVNVIWRLVTGVSYSLDDPQMNYLLKISNEMMQSTSLSVDVSIAFPKLLEWFPGYFKLDEQRRIRDNLFKFCRDTIEERREAGDYNDDPKGFVDIFLQKIDESKDDTYTCFTDDQLTVVILDLFQAGSETSSKTLTFGVLYLLLNPTTQEKAYKEIASVVPPNAPITMSQRNQLPYCYATLLEVLRHSTVVPFPALREAPEDFYLKGHFIKRGTAIMCNQYAAHFSTDVWGDPFAFRPERFLTSEGRVDPKLENFVLPFGGGKRLCVGRNLGEANLFIYFTTIIRNYKFVKIPNTPDPSAVPVAGMTHCPKPFSAQVIKRNSLK